MALELKQGLKLSQQLRMTPQLQQAIKLLQLSRLELETVITKEMEENPILEEAMDTADEDAAATKETEQLGMVEDNEAPVPQADDNKKEEFEWENYVEDNYRQATSQAGIRNTEEVHNYENLITRHESLQEYLLWQLKLSGFNEEEERIGTKIIGNIDDDGYLKMPLEEVCPEENLPVEDLVGILELIQELDPPGVAARNLQECLLVQAKVLGEDTNDVIHVIKNHMKDLEKKNFEGIAKAMGKPLDEMIEICKVVFDMEPKPGRSFAPTETQYVTPDVYVYKVGDEYVVSLNEDGLPRLKISNFYKNVLQGKGSSTVTKEYIQDKLRSAVWLIKSIHQRQRTIYKVTESIVRYQRDFLDKGLEFLRPMILRDIANDIGMHESTVSRVTTAKYVHTPRGIFELKYFFNSGINKTDGDSLASESVKEKIKELVSQEDIKNPYSDQKIVELLKNKSGIDIARRTVAKYRDILGILPSSKRKKYF
ncbi:MAG: RNA polymerase factor sigma-54 [Oligoflexia bacterium]|nr:RNA polymerase factor sigma-54 [Oligoflexia bacterium]